jgi:MFS transporter, FHS family, L-fucose permease
MVALIMLTFFVISFLTNIFGPLVPDLKTGFGLSLTTVAVLPFAFFIAYGVMSIPSGMLVEKYGMKRNMIAAFLMAFIGSLLIAFHPDYPTFVISLFLIGSGMAMLQVVINPLLRTAGGEEHYAFYSILAQLIFGAASFVSPWVYTAIVTDSSGTGFASTVRALAPAGLPWVSMYWIFTAICMAMLAIILVSRFPKVELTEEERPGAWKVHLELFRNRTVQLYFLGLVCYVGTEQGVANWISQFLQTYHGQDPATTGARTVAFFWGLMTAGGILGLVLVKIMDSRKVLILFTTMAMACLALALFGSSNMALVFFPLVGFFASVMYPIVFSLALNSVKEHHGSFSGILCTGIAGGAIVPLIIGWLGDQFGLRMGMLFLFLTMGYILSVGFWARPLITNQTISLKKGELADKS